MDIRIALRPRMAGLRQRVRDPDQLQHQLLVLQARILDEPREQRLLECELGCR